MVNIEGNRNFVIDGKIDSNDKTINNIEKRAIDSFGLLVGKTFKKGEIIPMMYKTPDGYIINYKLDTNTNKILFNDKVFSIKFLESVIINKVDFTDNKIIIHGKMGIINGKMEATYKKTIESIDEIYNYINNR